MAVFLPLYHGLKVLLPIAVLSILGGHIGSGAVPDDVASNLWCRNREEPLFLVLNIVDN
jgi:hypothetical protein